MAKMTMSLSFKGKEECMWEHLQKQFNAPYYIKSLIYDDMNKAKIKEEKTFEIKKTNANDEVDLELDF